jgi:hypothetical protein
MRALLIATLTAVVAFGSTSAHAQGEPLYHGTLTIRPARGGIDKSSGIGSLKVNNWDLFLGLDENGVVSNGIAPDREPVMIAIGETERLVIPAGEVRASRNGKTFTFRNPKVGERGIRFFQMRQLRDNGGALARYRVRFSLVGIDLSGLLVEFPLCKSLAIIVGDDDGFEGVDLDRPGGFSKSKVRVLGSCQAQVWPWT